MPIYEFVCESCGGLAEVMQKLSDPAPATCTECGKGPMARTVSRTSFQLKGGGWYADLYASKKEAPAAGAKPGAGKDGTASATGGEKPAASAPAPAPAAPAAPSATGSGSGSGSGTAGASGQGGGAGTT